MNRRLVHSRNRGRIFVGAGTWSPPSSSSVIGWWDASNAASVTVSGGTASQVNNLLGTAGNLVQATGAKQPGYGSTTMNGRNTLHQSGSRVMTATLVAGLGDMYVAAAVNVLGTSAAYTTLCACGSFSPAAYLSSTAHAANADWFHSIDHHFTDVTITTGPHFFEFWRSGTTAFFAMDGVTSAVTPSVPSTTSTSNFAIFSDTQAGTNFGNIDIGELLVYGIARDAATGAAILARFRSKWGTP